MGQWKMAPSSRLHRKSVLVTTAGNLEFQQNLSKYQIGVIVVHVAKNQLAHYRTIQKDLLAAIENVGLGEAIHVQTSPF
jgi:hypothetical protein